MPGKKVPPDVGDEVAKSYLGLDIADLSAEATYFLVAPCEGRITKFRSIIDGAVATADVTITPSIDGVAVTDGLVTIATAASAAGDVDDSTPSAANKVAIGSKISMVVTGGGAGGTPRGHVVIEILRD